MATSTITKEWVEEKFVKALDTWKKDHPEPSDPNELNDRVEAFKIIAEIKKHTLEACAIALESPGDSESVKRQKKICNDIVTEAAKPIYSEYIGKMLPFGDSGSQMLKGFASLSSLFGTIVPNKAIESKPETKSTESKPESKSESNPDSKSNESKPKSRPKPIYYE